MLERLLTELGERSDYDAASQCSRCGYCEQACPTYVATGREAMSPRGRNQIVRSLLEGKLSDPSSAEEALSSCLLCSACTTVCPASVPTADLVLEGRRMLREGKPHWIAALASRLLVENPALFEALIRWGNRFKRWGLAGLAARFKILRVLGLPAMETAILHMGETPSQTLREILREQPERKGGAWAYFTTCGTNFLFPQVGKSTLHVLESSLGEGTAPEHPCCGLLSFNYGSVEDARTLARRTIEKFEGSDCPVVGDCSSCVAFLKSYPQLFLSEGEWKKRAEAFVTRVRDFSECLDPKDLPTGTVSETGTVTLHDACRARNGQGIIDEPRAVMRSLGGDRCRELGDGGECCGGAGAFSAMHPELSDVLLRKKIGAIADTQASMVLATSTSCLLQLVRGLKVYYPECRVLHLSQWIENSLPK
ncbi:MAG: hypothetical protein COB53_05065 [Elusimicrobia bacterium]|nr:MAG: hypothetical protein COB53_05065 [Elusimicrobiota bacterium]